jgi:2,4-dienoyl-CoA reductase-like NADH-dependent reductase (Old Yellow Enzyme family)
LFPRLAVAEAHHACEAGSGVIEIHAAHGYLIHEFLSPHSNQRTDAYGGSFENRTRMLRETVASVRGSWPDRAPLFVRISATDWIDGGWDIQQSVELARQAGGIGLSKRLKRRPCLAVQPSHSERAIS